MANVKRPITPNVLFRNTDDNSQLFHSTALMLTLIFSQLILLTSNLSCQPTKEQMNAEHFKKKLNASILDNKMRMERTFMPHFFTLFYGIHALKFGCVQAETQLNMASFEFYHGE